MRLYVLSRARLMTANRKRIADFAVKSRLPAMYDNREYVEAGGLMSYGATIADMYRRVAYLRGQDPERSQASRSAGGAADEVRVRHQSQSRQADRPDDSAERAGAGG